VNGTFVVLAAFVKAIVKPFVVIVDGDRQDLLGTHLADDVLIKHVLDFLGLGKLVLGGIARILQFLANDVIAKLDTFVADEDRRACNQLADLMLRLAAKRTIKEFAVLVLAAGIVTHTRLASVSKKISLLQRLTRL
jgi:hypothetical protein